MRPRDDSVVSHSRCSSSRSFELWSRGSVGFQQGCRGRVMTNHDKHDIPSRTAFPTRAALRDVCAVIELGCETSALLLCGRSRDSALAAPAYGAQLGGTRDVVPDNVSVMSSRDAPSPVTSARSAFSQHTVVRSSSRAALRLAAASAEHPTRGAAVYHLCHTATRPQLTGVL